MAEKNNRLDEISDQLDENILAVKGTLELLDTSVTEDELHELLMKAVERMDTIQKLSHDMLGALKNCVDKMGELKK
jgi:DNA-binding FrmR family transcriptional regulator